MSTIDGTAEEIGTELVAHDAPPPALFGTSDPVEVVEHATRVANSLAAVIEAKGLFTMIQGKKHIDVAGWTLLGSMLGVTAICVGTEPVDGGYKASVEARTADGRVIGRADALCTKHEKRGPWKTADDYARLSMAQTRATSKALKGPLGFVVSLAGYEATPSDEMTFAEPDKPKAATSSKLKADIGPPSSEQTANAAVLWNEAKMTVADQHRLLDRVGAPGHHKQDPLERVGEMNARSMGTMIDVLSEGQAA